MIYGSNLPQIDRQLLEAADIQVLQLGVDKIPVITNAPRLLKANHTAAKTDLSLAVGY